MERLLEHSKTMGRKTIVHLFGGETNRGEERFLQTIIDSSGPEFHHIVVDICRSGHRSALLSQSKNYIACPIGLNKEDVAANVQKLLEIIAPLKPSVLQGWALPGNAYATFVTGKMNAASKPALALRLSNPRKVEEMPPDEQDIGRQMLAEITNGQTVPDAIFSVSRETADSYHEMGIKTPVIQVIHNGVDTQKFKPDDERHTKRSGQRTQYGIPEDARGVIGIVSPFDPQKGLDTFVEAAGILHADPAFNKVHFVLRTEKHPELVRLVEKAGIAGVTHFIEAQNNMAPLYHLADIWTNSSRGEAFSGVMLEALASGKLFVMTNTDMAKIFAPAVAQVVPMDKPDQLARAWGETLALDPQNAVAIRAGGTRFIENNFSLTNTASAYAKLYASLCTRLPERPQR